MMDKTTYLLAAGHVGVAFDQYLMNGKQSPRVPPGIYEGAFNRLLAADIEYIAKRRGVRCVFLNPGPINVSNWAKVSYANALYAKLGKPPMVYISIHANAAPGYGWSDATGLAIFHAHLSSTGTGIAQVFEKHLMERSGLTLQHANCPITSRGIKAKNFTELWRTKMFAILVENLFMTNLRDVKLLSDPMFIWEWAGRYVNAMEALDEIGQN